MNAPDRQRPLASPAPSDRSGEVLVDVGDKDMPFFVVVSGEVQALRVAGATEVVAHGPGQFSGEGIMITGRRAMERASRKASSTHLYLVRSDIFEI